MSIKEKPLIDAVSKLGPLPGFLFANMFVTGFFAIIMVAVFGAVFALFQAAGRGTVEALALYEIVRLGAGVALAFAAFILIGITFTAFDLKKEEPEDANGRLSFVAGGVAAIVVMTVGDYFARDWLLSYFAAAGPLV